MFEGIIVPVMRQVKHGSVCSFPANHLVSRMKQGSQEVSEELQ